MLNKFNTVCVLSLSAVLSVCSHVFAGSVAEEWAQQTTPATKSGFAQSIGKYTAGCLSGAVALPLNGPGYQVMRLSRRRYYGHPDLIEFIRRLGGITAEQKLGAILIGDLGQPRGGPTLNGHRSHQTGLDVDIWFLLDKQTGQRLLSESEREAWNATSVVDARTERLDMKIWTPNHQKILEAAAQQPEVDRIFVNPSIKLELCRQPAAAGADWLRKIRPWYKHDDHFHVRLKCPVNNTLCETQEPIPAGNGCDASLDWWFSAEAKLPAKTPPAPAPPLPAQCEAVLRE